MRTAWKSLACIALCALTAGKLPAQGRHDSLTEVQVDQLRDTAQDPDSRLRLYIKFSRQKLDDVDQIRADPKITDKPQQTHDKLQEFVDIYDELNDNIDTYSGQRFDIRRVLKTIVETDTQFEAKLRALRDSSQGKAELKQYEFVLTDALDDLDSSAKDHVQLLADQEEAAKHKKLIQPQPPANLPKQ